jgi:hypothetical protein
MTVTAPKHLLDGGPRRANYQDMTTLILLLKKRKKTIRLPASLK